MYLLNIQAFYCIIWKVSPLLKVSPPLESKPPPFTQPFLFQNFSMINLPSTIYGNYGSQVYHLTIEENTSKRQLVQQTFLQLEGSRQRYTKFAIGIKGKGYPKFRNYRHLANNVRFHIVASYFLQVVKKSNEFLMRMQQAQNSTALVFDFDNLDCPP